MNRKFGIDLSHWNKKINLDNAKNIDGVEFAIIKFGGSDAGRYKDSMCETYYEKCKSLGLEIGAYYFGKDLNKNDALKSADHFISLLNGHEFDYPVFYDVEADMLKVEKNLLTEIIKTFCDRVSSAGYEVGIYSSSSHYNNNMKDPELEKYHHWVANWGKNVPVLRSGNTVEVWQFGGERNLLRSNKIGGVVCDQNYCYVDFKKSGEEYEPVVKEDRYDVIINKISEKDMNALKEILNSLNITAEIKKVADKSNIILAQEVIEGKWGNGADRKKRLTDAGYDYSEVQRLVNKILS